MTDPIADKPTFTHKAGCLLPAYVHDGSVHCWGCGVTAHGFGDINDSDGFVKLPPERQVRLDVKTWTITDPLQARLAEIDREATDAGTALVDAAVVDEIQAERDVYRAHVERLLREELWVEAEAAICQRHLEEANYELTAARRENADLKRVAQHETAVAEAEMAGRKQAEAVTAKLRAFAVWAWDAAADGGDLDGGSIQDKAVELGLLAPTEATEPCGPEGACRCAGYDDFPTTCYRPTALLRDTASKGWVSEVIELLVVLFTVLLLPAAVWLVLSRRVL